MSRRQAPWRRAAVAGLTLCMAAFVSGYAAVFAVIRVQHFYLPSNPFKLPSVLGGSVLPGVTKADVVESKRITILLAGFDSGAGPRNDPTVRHHNSRTDSLQLITLDPKTHSAGVIGIPRDSYLKYPEKGYSGPKRDRINTAYEYGFIYKYPGGGVQLLEDVIELNYGIHVDYFVGVDWDAFRLIVDAVGGVDITVDKYLYSDQVQIPSKHQNFARFEPGEYHMDGETALAYARMRPDSDFGRIKRQQQVMVAVARQALKLGAVSRWLDIYHKYKDAIETDLPDIRAPGLAQLANSIGLDNARFGSLSDAVAAYTGPGCAALLLPLMEKTAQVVTDVFGSVDAGEGSRAALAAAGYTTLSAFPDYARSCATPVEQPEPRSTATPPPATVTPTPAASRTPTPAASGTPTRTATGTPGATISPTATHTPGPTPAHSPSSQRASPTASP